LQNSKFGDEGKRSTITREFCVSRVKSRRIKFKKEKERSWGPSLPFKRGKERRIKIAAKNRIECWGDGRALIAKGVYEVIGGTFVCISPSVDAMWKSKFM